jgi:hypothetical protein
MHVFKIPHIWIIQTLINFCFSIDLNASLPQVGGHGIRLGILVGNFGDPLGLAFYNLIILQTLYVGEILYYIIDQLNKSTKNLKIRISVCPTKVSRPSFNNYNLQPKF